MSRRTLVLGGARSGKSAHAEGLLPADDDVTYVATGRRDPDDPEWTARIDAHIARRPYTWRTVEATRELADVVRAARGPTLVDDVATWLTGVMDAAGAWAGAGLDLVRREGAFLVEAVAATEARIVLVSAEVGLGVVPPTRSGRLFRDELGALNAALAQRCDEVLLLVAGIPLRLR
ncbi:bifunctional adenosylcobinamide kinase/adenosylcobinamide-phosphate guanylyltransferase [Actinocrispum wychmicini]|uniref:Adenosylcobinamide kinase n=1 Tax=Actinocrispum wychmicini TaxID=1213861 RepID=A0A4R2IUE8_9PSEU|nr:bifunctional adenosylcobinamide kinase/adenosylcobinamide-phosphate guanylyltransferase [Actinocrispum wychmicini]TCO48046.1 adenosylcobinamide kinase /adenosylcobinamide-phosphate guanylyltransferase [Actinocrispum wychmicini]